MPDTHALNVERYARHIVLREIGGPGQARLNAAHIALVGVGGLGSPAALYLAAAGIGTLTLIDNDAVSLSNLQRQILYATGDVGAPKTEKASKVLSGLNPGVSVRTHAERLTPDTAAELLAGADLVLDGTDEFATRFAVNAACHANGQTLISGAVGRWEGQVATFKSGLTRNAAIAKRLPCYRCFVPEIPPDAETCAAVGVVGALTGVIGSVMAMEAIKDVTGAGESLAGRLWLYDGLSGEARTVRLPADPNCPVCGEGD